MSRGKYAAVINSLPRMLGEEPAYQQKIEAVKQVMREEENYKQHAVSLATQYAAIRCEKDDAEEKLKEINLRLEATSQLMSEQFEVEGVSSLKLDNGRGVSIYYEPYAYLENKDAFRQWCIDNQLIGSMSLPWQTMNAITKERLLAGDPEPPGVKVYAKTKIRLGS